MVAMACVGYGRLEVALAIVITTFTQKSMGQLALQRIGKYDTSCNLC